MTYTGKAGTIAYRTDDRKASTVRWRIFAIIFVLVVINLIDRVTLSIAMPTIAKEFAIEPAFQGLILSAFFWSYALLRIPGGWLIGTAMAVNLLAAHAWCARLA